MVGGGTDDPHKPRDPALHGGLAGIVHLPPDKVTDREIDMVKKAYEARNGDLKSLVPSMKAENIRPDFDGRGAPDFRPRRS